MGAFRSVAQQARKQFLAIIIFVIITDLASMPHLLPPFIRCFGRYPQVTHLQHCIGGCRDVH